MHGTARPSTALMSPLNLWMKWLWWTWLWMVTALQRPDQPSDTMVPDHNCALTVNIPWSRLWISGGLIDIDKAPVGLVSNFKFLGVTITEDLRWSTHTNSKVRKAQVFECSTDSILLCCVWYRSCTIDQPSEGSREHQGRWVSHPSSRNASLDAVPSPTHQTLSTQTTTCSRPVRTPSLGNTINMSPAGSKTVIFHLLSGCWTNYDLFNYLLLLLFYPLFAFVKL